MGKVRVIEIHEDVMSDNNKEALEVRDTLDKKGTFLLNVMSSPGSGKTTALSAVINLIKDKLKVALMDVDIESSLDADKVSDLTGVPSIQIHNGGLCHIDASMTKRAIAEFDAKDVDLLILENIGNLVCPAEFDTGAHKNIMIFSVPEGDDKPLKYPLMFSVCDVVLISKMDTVDFFDFDMEKAKSNIRGINKDAIILPISAKTGEGMDEFAAWILDSVNEHKRK
ncbi:MAG: hydrogenase nickel incorporation protein HypB [Lachnospiraceae bacterium]|nr:hydrogenase nickel incorporation protein HypB [Lachnospiraceae bacterium]